MTIPSNCLIATARRQLDEGQYAHALDLAESALTSEPNNSDLLLLKVDALLALERFVEALSISIELVTSVPNAASHWHALCCALRSVGYDELAMRVNAYALELAASDFETVRFRGDTLFESDRFDEARVAYEPVLRAFGQLPIAWSLWYNYSSCLYAAGRVNDSREADRNALRLLQQLLATGNVTGEKRLAALWFHQGMLYFRMEQWLLAEQVFYRSLRSDAQSMSAFGLWYTCRRERKWLSAMLILPWAARNKWLDIRRKGAALDDKLQQRASISSETLHAVEEFIAS